MKTKLLLTLLIAAFSCFDMMAAEKPLRVFIRASAKTHGPGQHDHPRFLKEWTVLLNQRGAVTTGTLEFPTAAQLKATDVLVMFAHDAGNIEPEQRKNLETFIKRGGGFVVIHSAVAGHDPQWFKTIIGGAWEYKHSKFRHGDMDLNYTNAKHPITRGAKSFSLPDEIYWQLRLMPKAKILATSPTPEGKPSPQMWTYENGNSRVFVSIPGHYHVSFNLPQYRAVLLRGIAWAGKRDIGSLVNAREVAALGAPPAAPPIQKVAPVKKAAAKKAPVKKKPKPAPVVYTGPAREFPWGDGTRVLITGGNKSHDFDRWYKQEDVKLLRAGGKNSVFYTDHMVDVLGALDDIDVLYLSNNQAFLDKKTRDAIMKFAASGKGLVLAHAALWYNWKDWPEYNRELVGGGSRKHDKLGPFEVDVVKSGHPVMKGVPKKFALTDELYHLIPDVEGTPIEVLSQSTSPVSGTTYPSTYIVKHAKARIVCITLGHDADSHELPAYRTMLKNAIKWAAGQ